MCRNIKPLFNFEPVATAEEIHSAAIQYVRKVSGFPKPSAQNEAAFDCAVAEIAASTERLMDALVTVASPKNRDEEAKKAHIRALKRFGAS
jgi:hypothetical protein